MKWTIWNCDTAKPVRSNLTKRKALKLAGLLERLFDGHYTVVRL